MSWHRIAFLFSIAAAAPSIAVGAWLSYDTSRRLAFGANLPSKPIPGGLDRIAQSSQQGMADDLWTEVTDSVKIRTWTYDGKVGWRHARYRSDALKETGAQSLSLEAAPQAEHSTWASEKTRRRHRVHARLRSASRGGPNCAKCALPAEIHVI